MPIFESEKEFEDVLMANQGILSEEFGGDSFARQVNMFGYGAADIVGFSTEFFGDECLISVTIYELKKGKIDFNAIGQVCRYIRATERFIEKTDIPRKLLNARFHVSGVVIGNEVGSGDVCYLADALTNVSAYSYEINAITGLILKEEANWFQTSEALSISKTKPIRAMLESFNCANDYHKYEKKRAQNEH